MKSNSLEDIIKRIDELNQIHLSLRGVIQYVNEQHIGNNKINWGSKVPSSWFDIEFSFHNHITNDTRNEINVLAEYLNQNFIIRLHSLLEYEGIKSEKSNIDTELEGYEMIQLIHFLRKQYAHKLGVFNPEDPKSVQLRERLFKQFNINPEESLPNQFPLDKNRVIKPIVKGTKQYVVAYWMKYRAQE